MMNEMVTTGSSGFGDHTLHAKMPSLGRSFFVPGVLTSSGVVSAAAHSFSRFTIHKDIPDAATAFGVNTPRSIETLG